jgi:1-aminocyclopropane-1-carboxylate synthase
MNTLSNRGHQAVSSPLRIDWDITFEALDNQYHPEDNPSGDFALNIAENRLQWPKLKQKFRDICANNELPDWVMGYTSTLGDIYFREAVAQFYQEQICEVQINPDLMGISGGATGIVEMSALILANPKEYCAIPAPAYPVYEKDLGNIAGVLRYDLISSSKSSKSRTNTVSISTLTEARKNLKKKGKKLKMVVITTPDNPTGQEYTAKKLSKIAQWCISKHIHLIVNEIYALSKIETVHPDIKGDYKSGKSYCSFLDIMHDYRSDYLHHWYSMSKDFGISGFRIGVVYSHNEQFIKAYENLNIGHTISNHTQWMMAQLLQDTRWVNQYITDNQHLLTQSYVSVIKLLKKHKIPYVPARGGLFVWIDLSKYLAHRNKTVDELFWKQLYEKTGVLLTPGHGFGHKEYGKYRLVYPYVSYADLQVALSRLDQFFSK